MRVHVSRIFVVAWLCFGCGGKDEGGKALDGGSSTADMQASDEQECVPSCQATECGDDGCGGECGICKLALETCTAAGQCVPFSCKSTKDCPGNLLCHQAVEVCVVCLGDEDCEEGAGCGADLECHEEVPCVSHKDCKDDGLLCDQEAGQCVECLGSVDCAADEHCIDMTCAPDICEAGEKTCDGNSVLVCVEDGSSREFLEGCQADQFCQAGICEDHVCPAGATYCEGNFLTECADDGQAVASITDCAAQQMKCVAAECVESACEEGESFCDDALTVAVCVDGTDYSLELCPAEEICQDGQCEPWICEPSSQFCDGQILKECNEAGTGIGNQTNCFQLDAECIDGECLSAVCQPSTQFCSDNKVMQCDDTGEGSALVETCSEGDLCVESDTTASCVELACVPDQKFCESAKVMQCNEAGSDYSVLENCAQQDKECENGECIDCEPQCQGKQCGPDGCGGVCGTCLAAEECTGDGLCLYVDPCDSCAPYEDCVDDTCMLWFYGLCPGGGLGISDDCLGLDYLGCCDSATVLYCGTGQSQCPPGIDECLCLIPCGLTSSTCGWNWDFGLFECMEGESGGPGPQGEHMCSWYECDPVDCTGKECGDDGCGGLCGVCMDELEYCTFESECCVPDCEGQECGDDGCGFACGSCAPGYQCFDGLCKQCDDGNNLDWDGCTDHTITEFRVNQAQTGAQTLPSVAALNNGGYVIAFQSDSGDGDGKAVVGQVYGPDGAQQGNNFGISVQTAGNQREPRVAALDGGGFVAVWYGLSPEDSGANGASARLFNNQGGAVSGDILMNTYTQSYQERSRVAALPGGGFVGVWRSFEQDGAGGGIFAQLFDASGDKLGWEFKANSYADGNQHGATVASAANGNFLVVWAGKGPDANQAFWSQAYEPDGTKIGEMLRVDWEGTSPNTDNPEVLALSDGRFVVLFHAIAGNEQWYLQVVENDGTKDGSQVLGAVNEGSAPGSASFSDGRFLVLYDYVVDQLSAQFYTPSATKLGEPFVPYLLTGTEKTTPTAAELSDGGWVMVWASGDQDLDGLGVFAQRYDVTGAKLYH